ncbi:MAG: prop effector [Polaromonas sp.]|nr:prop effector [Polaromonas sp.]
MTDATPEMPASELAGNRRRRPPQQQQRQPQAPRAVSPVLEKLFELYPKMFGAQFLPLKLGTFQDILARHPDLFKKDELKLAMGQHARSTRYLESVAAGHARHDLDGEPVEAVAPEHVHHAILELFRRRQLRAREDLKPQLVQRLVEAMDASGLTPEDYVERVRVQDDATNALMDEALSEMRLLAARREALARTFAASGKTVAEFADMYGLKPADVSRALEAVKAPAA